MESQPKKKRKHTTLLLADKWEIIERFGRGESARSLSKIYGIGRSTIHDIIKNKHKLEIFMRSGAIQNRKTLKTGDFPEVEWALFAWYQQRREINAPISGDILRSQAKYFYEEITKKRNFAASEGWLDKFKKRFGIRFNQQKSIHDSEFSDYISQHEGDDNEMSLLPDQYYHAEMLESPSEEPEIKIKEEPVDSSCIYTISCDEALAAATTLLHWCEERSVGLDSLLVLKNLYQIIENKQTEESS